MPAMCARGERVERVRKRGGRDGGAAVDSNPSNSVSGCQDDWSSS